MSAHPLRRRLLGLVTAVTAALALSPSVALPAAAAEVANDRVAGAVDLAGALPLTWTQDTTGAAVNDEDDTPLVEGCLMSFAVERTVWFTYTDPTGAGFGLDPEASDYESSVAVFQGDPREGAPLVACGEGEVAAQAEEAGQRYWIAAFADRPGSTGGTLRLTARPMMDEPTTPVFTVDPTVTVRVDRTAVVSGTYACTNTHASEESRWLSGSVAAAGAPERLVSYFYAAGLVCDGGTHRWTVDATTFDGVPFSGGPGVVRAQLVAAGDLASSIAVVTADVRGTRAR